MKREIGQLKDRIRELESELEGEKKRLETVLQSIVDGVYTTDNQRRITFWNNGAERITGYKSGEVLGKPCSEILSHVDERGNSLCAAACPISESMTIRTAIYGKDVYSGTASGRPVPVSVSCAPIMDSHGKVSGAIEVFRDISEKKKLEKEKADFYSMVTHDLKSPLTVILGYAELMAGAGDLKEPYRNNIKTILENGKRLDSMIMDYLAVSKINSSGLSPVIRPGRLDALLTALSEDFKSVADRKNISLNLSCPALPEAEYDPKLLERALSNLISNAVKFTPEGGTVTVSAALSGGSVTVSVADTGPGIPDEDKEKVFEMYFRSEAASGVEGTGLGLAIAKAVAEEHGGGIVVRDADGGGSVFMITIPLESPLKATK